MTREVRNQTSPPVSPSESNDQSIDDWPLDTGDSPGDYVLPEDESLPGLSAFLLAQDRRARSGQKLTKHAEDATNQRRSVYNICQPSTPQVAGTHLRSHLATCRTHKPHELEYMRCQGVFTRLPEDVCDALVHCYFRHVHFYVPIVDAPAFLNDYCAHGAASQTLSGLLLWSMFLASANVRPSQLPSRLPCHLRRARR